MVDKFSVALQDCQDYGRDRLKRKIEQIARAAGLRIKSGSRVLLKPNLVAAGTGPLHLACTSPDFVAAVAEWCLDHGARVRVGDSPAFGSGRMVMAACGLAEKLRPLGVKPVDFRRSRTVTLPCGIKAPISVAALDSDVLVNLPRVKAHNQLYVSLAVKNYFGVVSGWRKALHHAVNGDVGNRFEELLVDLPGLFGDTFTLLDGVIAMHRAGPMAGDPYPLGLIGGAIDPVALDTAVMRIIGADYGKSRIWLECRRRGLAGADPGRLEFPLLHPRELFAPEFILPEQLSPVTFHPGRILIGACRRGAAVIFKP
ncbi:MAG: DUF362 domain-containing protein [Desulfurivibrionaceae bacterium]|nr:DUF362 domain-containing protein [Desulfobulbales bacterium]MDT8335909.1 DUF362 domain-containing protein [Desulfurivibrionaceae bacterium]